MITMSALPRLLNCTGSTVLPRAENASVYADAGNDDHAELAAQVVSGTLPPKLAAVVPAGARAEVKIAYDVATRTSRIIGEGDGRGYGIIGPFEIAGSLDVLATDGDAVVVVDWKTGYLDVDPAESNWQLWGYGLAAARALGKDSATVRIVYTKTGRIDEYEIDMLELAAFADRLEDLFAHVAQLQLMRGNEAVSTREGSWCKHCASKPFCPSKNALLIQLSGRGLTVVGDSTMTADKAADAVREFVRVEQLVRDAKARLIDYVDTNGPIDMGDGDVYGRYIRQGDERLDGAVAVKAIREVVGESAKEFEAVAIKRVVSKAALERAAKAIGEKPKLAAAVVKRIRDLGGSTHASDEHPVGRFRLDKNQPALPPSESEIAEINRLLETA